MYPHIRILPPEPRDQGQRGVAIVIQSQRCAGLEATDAETQLLVETARRLQASGVAVLMADMPDVADPVFRCRAESIWARQQLILSLFQTAHRRYPGFPVAVLAIGEGAQSVEALLRRPRPETSRVAPILLADVPRREGVEGRCCVVSDCEDFRAQVQAAGSPMWREVLAESYTSRIVRGLEAEGREAREARYA